MNDEIQMKADGTLRYLYDRDQEDWTIIMTNPPIYKMTKHGITVTGQSEIDCRTFWLIEKRYREELETKERDLFEEMKTQRLLREYWENRD